jgi:mannose-6-phosphate isomerase-like protein (cupin superfamily)
VFSRLPTGMDAQALVEIPLLDHGVGSERTDFRVSEFEEPAAPADGVRRIAPLHRHRSEDEAWYVLRGRLRFRFGSEEFEAPEGSGVLLPHGVAHTFWNPAPEPARYLLIARPKTVALLRALHRPRSPQQLGLKDLFSKFEVDLLE